MAFPVNPHEGQVAIPFSESPTGHVVGVLGARAIRWVEETLGESFDLVYERFSRSQQTGSVAGLSTRAASVVVWAALEHHRRKTGAPGPEWTLDRVDDIVDEIGRDVLYTKAWTLMFWSLSGRSIRSEWDRKAREAGAGDEWDAGIEQAEAFAGADSGEVQALTAGTGTSTSAPPSEPVSTTTPSGD